MKILDIQKFLKSENSVFGYVTIIDFALHYSLKNLLNFMQNMKEDMKQFEKLLKYIKCFENNPKIKEFVLKNKETPFIFYNRTQVPKKLFH